MPTTVWEKAHLLLLGVFFGLPISLELVPDFAALAGVFVLALLVWLSTATSEDPFLSTTRVTLLAGLLCANAAAYSLSGTPALPKTLDLAVGATLLAYLLILVLLINRSARRVADIDHEYFQYSLPSKRLNVDLGRRTGRLDQATAARRLQLFVKEGLQFRRLSRVCRLLMLQSWGGLLVFLVFGFQEPWHLLIFLANSLVISASATSIASRATLHSGPVDPKQNDWVDVDDDEEDEEEYEEFLVPKRRR